MTPTPPNTPTHETECGEPPRDELDGLLRQWHTVHAEQAAAGRDRLLAALAHEPAPAAATQRSTARPSLPHILRSMLMNRYSPAAIAALLALALLVSFLLPPTTPPAHARDNVVFCPEGGRLEAIGADGHVLGPCELVRTDVEAHISGFLTRVTLRQQYRNPHPDKIEAVYTFPMSHRAAVDRMTMTIGDRVITGQVKERQVARRMYEAARAQGRVASLLEQERPNIFTQSIANIEPGASIDIEISYVEVLEASEGVYTFSFPTVVGPRYIPGTPSRSEPPPLPEFLKPRPGLVLLAPAEIAITHTPEDLPLEALTPARLRKLVGAATPCEPLQGQGGPDEPRRFQGAWHHFIATYPDGSVERGYLDQTGIGHINGRFFWIDIRRALAPDGDANQGQGFAENTMQVPDASRITPMPVKPPMRAGHDIGITVTIDTGGPALAGLTSTAHEIVREDDHAARVRIALKNQDEIPNRDFVLSWSLAKGEALQEAMFTHTGPAARGNFFSLILHPPARVQAEQAVPRELIFVLDTSGSMSGYPIEKSKQVMARAIESMRPQDTFNIITFSGHTDILWPRPRPNTAENRADARAFVQSQRGRGGTEMMKAIEAALQQQPAERGEDDADDAPPAPLRIAVFLTDGHVGNDMAIIDAVKRHRGTTRVFSLGIGSSVNRYLLDGMARAGGGEVEYVLLESSADAAVERLTRRISTPVLANITLDFEGVEIADLIAGGEEGGAIPDLFDVKPLVIHGRYTRPGEGKLIITGTTGQGAYRRELELTLPAQNPEHDTIATLWARQKVEAIMNRDLAAAQRQMFPAELLREVVSLGETFGIMTQYTSFVAVDHLRVTVGGRPRLVSIPVELPAGMRWEGIFGGPAYEYGDADGDGLMSFGFRDAPAIDLAGVLGGNGGGGQSPFTNVAEGAGQYFVADWPAKGAASGQSPSAEVELHQMWLEDLSAEAGGQESVTVRHSARMEVPAGEQWRLRGAQGVDRGERLAAARQRVREFQRNMRYDEALQTIDEVLFLDPLDAEALMMREALEDVTTYRRFWEAQRLGVNGGPDSPAQPEPTRIVAGGQLVTSAATREPSDALRRNRALEIERIATQHADRIPRPVIVLQIAEFDIAEGRAATARLAPLHQDWPLLGSLHQALHDDSLTEADRATRVGEIRSEALAELDMLIRQATIARRLDPALVPFAERTGLPTALDPPYAGERPAGVPWQDGGVQLTILVSDTDKATLDRVRALGIRIDHISASANVVLATVPLGRLADLALLDPVRRIEPMRFQDD